MPKYSKSEEEYLLALKADEAKYKQAEERRQARIEATKERRRKYAEFLQPNKCIGDPETGDPCSNTAVPGSALCLQHGGDITAAKKAAHLRFQSLLEPSFEVLVRCLASPDERTSFKAAEFVFNRAGFGPKTTLEIEEKPEDLSNLSDDALQSRARKLLERLAENPKKQPEMDSSTSSDQSVH